jgi:hypothetical protein
MFAGVEMEEVRSLATALRGVCAALDPDSVPLPEAPTLWAALDEVERLAAGAKLRLSRRVAEARTWAGAGDRSPAHWLARQAGTSVESARRALATSAQVAGLAGVDAALAAGSLSAVQAAAVAEAAAADPSAEGRLLEHAGRHGLGELRDRCARTKAAADPDAEARHRRHHHARSLCSFTDGEGAWHLRAVGTVEAGALIEAALAPLVEARFAEARRQGRRERHDAYAFDALLALAEGSGPADGSARPDRKVIALVDHAALLRGATGPGERCELAGVGPVPVSTVVAMLGDAFLAAVVTDGVDVHSVAHLGRRVTAHQRSALEARGYRCEVPDCDVSTALEIDHVTGWARTRQTRLDDLAWLCRHHHHQKTHCGYRLTGRFGQRAWQAPDARPPPA